MYCTTSPHRTASCGVQSFSCRVLRRVNFFPVPCLYEMLTCCDAERCLQIQTASSHGVGIKDVEMQTKIQPASNWVGIERAQKCRRNVMNGRPLYRGMLPGAELRSLHRTKSTSKGGKTRRRKADSSSKEGKREAGPATSYTRIHLQITASKTAGLLKYCIV